MICLIDTVGSVHGNVYGTEQGMEEVVQQQMCPCKYHKFGPMCLNLGPDARTVMQHTSNVVMHA